MTGIEIIPPPGNGSLLDNGGRGDDFREIQISELVIVSKGEEHQWGRAVIEKVCQCVERGGRIEGKRAGWNIFALWLLRLISFDHATIIISMVEKEREKERYTKRLTSDSSLIDRNDRVTS